MKAQLEQGLRWITSVGIALALTMAIVGGCGSSDGSRPASTGGTSTSPARPSSTSGTSTSPAPIHGAYSPSIDPANFVGSIDNRFLPFKPGTTLRYAGVAENGKTAQTDDEIVTHKTKRILGVTCTVIRDTVTSHGSPVERTYDWYAQDRQGNVWYFGEDSREYVHGRFVRGHDSWEAGVSGAEPGIIMEGDPQAGDAYRQEYYPHHAEDQARVRGSGGAVNVPYGSFGKTLATVERTPLEPGVREKKYYAAGIGEIKSQVTRGNHEAFQLVRVKRRHRP